MLETNLNKPYSWWLSQVMDYVSGMTDDYATRLSREIGGFLLLWNENVVRVSHERGIELGYVRDGLGFYILSFDEADDSERFVEVKTTTQGKYFPFFVTANEVRCSEATARQYHLYRLFRFSHGPRLYVLHGALSDLCRLEPMAYRATVAGKEASADA